MKLATSHEGRRGPDGLGWDELVAQKRKLSSDLKGITERLVDIDKNQLHKLIIEIRELKSILDIATERIKQIRSEVEIHNAELLSVSEKISQSKTFLSIMEARLPTESDDSLQVQINDSQRLLGAGNYKNDREKNEIMSRSKEALMKLEAIKATRIVKDQLIQLTQESGRINDLNLAIDKERDSIRSKSVETNAAIDKLYDTKRNLSIEREANLAEYDRIAHEFEAVNGRLDSMADMRRKQREEYGIGLPSDALFKVKEIARKKLESGGKLSFDELKLLYEEKD